MPNTPEIPQLFLPNFSYDDLFKPEKLSELTETFFAEVKATAPDAHLRFDAYRRGNGAGLTPTEISERIVDLAPYLDRFVARLFGVQRECEAIRAQAKRDEIIFSVKKDFFVRRTLKKIKKEEALSLDLDPLERVVGAVCAHYPLPGPGG